MRRCAVYLSRPCERGRRDPTLRNILDIAYGLGIDAAMPVADMTTPLVAPGKASGRIPAKWRFHSAAGARLSGTAMP
jgi:hypothetical protein